MIYHWINAEEYSMETVLLFDRWVIRHIMSENAWYNNGQRDYKTDMAKALSRYPYVIEFCKRKAPECAGFLKEIEDIRAAGFLKEIRGIDAAGISEAEARRAETEILSALEPFVVYAYPEVMEQLGSIRDWSPDRLYALADFKGKLVLDIGSGTGRLAFAAAVYAKRVYASEPCDVLREYMRDKISQNGISNMKVLDGEMTNLPYEDNTFDIVMAGHAAGDWQEEGTAEMTRVVKDGGVLVCCNGDDEVKREAPDGELVRRGFEYFVHESREGGVIYDYRKVVHKLAANNC